MRRVFVSSTSVDLREHRNAVRDAILTLGLHPIMMEHFPAMDAGALEVCRQKVHEADLFVGVYAHRYGYIPQGAAQSITEMEYDWARARDIPCYVYVVDRAYPWPDDLRDPENTALLDAFKARVGKELVWSTFTTPDSLAAKVTQSLAQHSGEQPAVNRGVVLAVVALLLMVLAAGAAFALNNSAQQTQNASATATAANAPVVMPPGFNVAVAGIGLVEEDGEARRDALADDITDILYAELQAVDAIDHVAQRSTPGVGYVLAAEAAARQQQAAEIAERTNADVVVYGSATRSADGFYINYAPEVYISAKFSALEPDFSGSESFGDTIQLLIGGSNTDTLVGQRVQVIQEYLRGLELYLLGEFSESRAAFERAAALSPEPVPILYVSAANAALRESTADADAALALNDAALEARPQYARALIGRGAALYRMGVNGITSGAAGAYDAALRLPTGITCRANPPQDAQRLLDLAEVCYREAQSSPDQIPENDIEIKSSFGLSQLYALRAEVRYTEDTAVTLQLARDAAARVLTVYDAGDAAAQARTRILAAQAHAVIAETWVTSDLSASIDHYQQATALLQEDVNQRYNALFITAYAERIAALERAQETASDR